MATVVREIERKYDPAARRQGAQAKELQQLLGDHHDGVVARTVLLDLAAKARAAGDDTFRYGLVYQSQLCQVAEIEQALPRSPAREGHRRRVMRIRE